MSDSDGDVDDTVCNRLRELYRKNLDELLRYAWEYIEWYKVSKYKYGYRENDYKKLFYKLMRVYYEGESCGLAAELPAPTARIIETVKTDILSMLTEEEYDLRLECVNNGLPQVVARFLASAVADTGYTGLLKKHVGELIDMHYEMLDTIYENAKKANIDAGDTKKMINTMKKLVECMEYEMGIATKVGVSVEDKTVSLFNECAGFCGYQTVK